MIHAKRFLILGAINGFLTVAFGAFAAHSLKTLLSPGMLNVFHTGVDYQGMHAIALLLVGILLSQFEHKALNIAGWAFTSGIILFSGSLYLLALTGISWLGAITPLGGVAFLIGWGCLAWGVGQSSK